jgi:hypothetical protein
MMVIVIRLCNESRSLATSAKLALDPECNEGEGIESWVSIEYLLI